jgi:aryl-alcohol dehydrogenase-like predicted oxidoreductase
LKFDEVSCVIPGASSVEQVKSNLSIFDLPPLSPEKFEAMNAIYEKYIKPDVHHRW